MVTDELVQLARDDREIEAVLAHEFGHQRGRHLLRHLLQDSVAAPTQLLQARYSRQFEREADDFALAYLARHHIPPETFAAILERLEKSRPEGRNVPDFLSTHPDIRVRIERARGAR